MEILKTDLKPTELARIIQSLMRFIVIEGKHFVNEQEKKAYIRSYLYTLTKSFNGVDTKVNMLAIYDQIKSDIVSGNADAVTE